jgi:hypothetical protein
MPGLAALLADAAPDPRAVEQAAEEAFGRFQRTDMRAGVANMIRRIAQLADVQPIEGDGWRALRDAAALLERPGLTPKDVRDLDERLKSVGLDVDRRSEPTP